MNPRVNQEKIVLFHFHHHRFSFFPVGNKTRILSSAALLLKCWLSSDGRLPPRGAALASLLRAVSPSGRLCPLWSSHSSFLLVCDKGQRGWICCSGTQCLSHRVVWILARRGDSAPRVGPLALAAGAVLVWGLVLVVVTGEVNKISKSLPICSGSELLCLRDHFRAVLSVLTLAFFSL